MKAYAGFLLIPAALLLGAGAAHQLPPVAPVLTLPAVQTLKAPIAPDAVSPVIRREPVLVDLRSLLPPPVVLLQPAPERAAPIVIAAILVDGNRRIAQIGTQAYQAGDIYAGYRVQSIEPMRVLLVSSKGQRLWVDLAKGY